MEVTKEAVLERLRRVNDPELHRDIVTLNMVKQIDCDNGRVAVQIELTTPACPMKERIETDVKEAIAGLGVDVGKIEVSFTANVRAASPQAKAASNNPLPDVKHIIAVGAGKGGVGKSTIAVNLAVGLARQGSAVGLLDGDIYGPSLPTMLGTRDLEVKAVDNLITPFDVHGIRAMTIGALTGDDKPLIWRGPMAHGAFRDLATRTNWGALDYLIIDLPPGTGDVPLTMSQLMPLTGAVVVCTPQRVAQDDARRAIGMFRQLNVHVLGIVENMSYFIGDDGKEYDIFGRGGAQVMADDLGIPFLGAVPINMRLRAHSDQGTPVANFENDAQLGAELENVVGALAGQVSVHVMGDAGQQPTISISSGD